MAGVGIATVCNRVRLRLPKQRTGYEVPVQTRTGDKACDHDSVCSLSVLSLFSGEGPRKALRGSSYGRFWSR